MSKDLIAGKLNRIKTVLEDLEDEEEKISEQISRRSGNVSGNVTSRSSAFSGGLLTSKNKQSKKPYFEIREQTEESVSMDYDEEDIKDDNFFDMKIASANTLQQPSSVNKKILQSYTQNR